MKTSLILFSLFLSLIADFGLCSAQQWTLGGRRKKIEELLPTQSCYYEQVCHSLIRGILIQSCSAGAKKLTNYVFCHPQFSGVIQNIENRCAIRAKFWKNWFLLYKIGYFDNNRHRQIGVKMAQRFSIFWITPLNCGWQNT